MTTRISRCLLVFLVLSATLAAAQSAPSVSPPEAYVNVSEILPLPEFIPNVGALYIDPANAPVGPYLAYGKDGQLVEVLYMVPLSGLNDSQNWDDLPAGILEQLDVSVDHVDISFNGGHPGMAEPHYHLRLVLVDPEVQQTALSQ